jgi:hypothetical protein
LNYYYLTQCKVGSVTLDTLQGDYLPQQKSAYQSAYLQDWQYQIMATNGGVVATISAAILADGFAERLVSSVVPGASVEITGGRISWEKSMLGKTQTSVMTNIERTIFKAVSGC